jgi:hypothetical protein
MPGLFALTSRVVGDAQMATFAAFGSFATLVLAGFGGDRRARLAAHAGLAVAGSVLLVIGTAVSASTALAAAATVPVVFVVLCAGIAGPNAASGATAALLAYVLPAASPGTLSMIPSRLEGWWLAAVAGALAVQVLYDPPPVSQLRARAVGAVSVLADQVEAFVAEPPRRPDIEVIRAAEVALVEAYNRTPYRPVGLAAADQAVGSMVEGVQWATTAVADALASSDFREGACPADRELLAVVGAALRETGRVLGGADPGPLEAFLRAVDALLVGDELISSGRAGSPAAVHAAFHSRLVAAAARLIALDALVATRQGDDVVIEELGRWQGGIRPRHASLAGAAVMAGRQLLSGHEALRSVWLLNSLRGAVALAAAVAVAGLTNVQHGFWVVLGALSVLRTNAAATGATAVRALLGTTGGFVIGAAIILAIDNDPRVLWAVLPVAVLVAAYAPGTAPFAVGQAAFTVAISVLYNIIVPVGWTVGELRVEDVALGVAVSAIAGVLFWPRGASGVVGDDLADAMHLGAVLLVQATAWVLGVRSDPPDGTPGVLAAADRLDGALRGFLAEQGSKRVPKQVLWRLAGGALRLRLSAQALALAPPAARPVGDRDARTVLDEAVRIAGRYDELAARVGRTPATVAQELAHLHIDDDTRGGLHDGRALWADQHLVHLARDLIELSQPAELLASVRSRPWWS